MLLVLLNPLSLKLHNVYKNHGEMKLEFDLKMVSYQIYSVLLTLEPFRTELIMPFDPFPVIDGIFQVVLTAEPYDIQLHHLSGRHGLS